MVLGGRAASGTSWNGLTIPEGHAAGYASQTSQWWGVQMSSSRLISSAGGDVLISGKAYQSAGVSSLYGISFTQGLIDAGSGSVELRGLTSGGPSSPSAPNFGVRIESGSPEIKASGGISISGEAQDSLENHQGVFLAGATLDSGSSGTTLTSVGRSSLAAGNLWKSPTVISATTDVAISGSQTANQDFTASCLTGAFTNPSGPIDSAGSVTINCRDITTSAGLTAGGSLTLDNSSTTSTSAINVNGNLISDTAGGSVLVKSKSDIITGNSVTIQTQGEASSAGGDIVLWSDSDASGEGFIRIGRNPIFNSIGGSTTDVTGGGDIHFGGGLDDGAATVAAGRVSGDGVPDGWAVSSTTMGIYVGYSAASGDLIIIHSGGGNISLFGKASNGSDALAFNWTTQVDSGQGQIEIRGESEGWGVQLNRSGENDTYPVKSTFTSRSNTSPAIYMSGSTTGTNEVALLGSWGDAGRDNLTIQSVGNGSIELIGSAPANTTLAAVGLTSTSVLSKSGQIKIDGGSGGIHLGVINSGQTQGQVQLGECAVPTCPNSLVTSSSADIELISNRITSHGSVGATLDTAGTAKFFPAVGSTAFTDFPAKVGGLTFSSDLGGLELGRADDTSAMDLTFDVNIAGPITINSLYTRLRGDLTTTGGSESDIRILAKQNIWTDLGVKLTTSGGDVVMWTNTDKVAGVNQAQGSVYLEPIEISTSGGKIWLAGGLDDGGIDAGITSEKGKWASVVAGDGLPDGYAFGDGGDIWWSTGVLINRNSVLKSGGGDIFIAGAQGVGTNWATGHILVFAGSKIDSGPGRIAMWGRSYGGSSSQGIALNYDGTTSDEPTMITSSASSADAITIYSDSSAGNTWSRGIIATWSSKLDATRMYQGTQIVATDPQGGITLTGIGAAAGSGGANGLYLDFVDILAKGGPITLNGSGPSAGSAGVTFGWHDNGSNDIRIGAWTAGNSGAVGGGTITTPSGAQYNMTSSTSDITINTDSIWTRETGVRGTLIATSGDFKVLPATQSGGVFAAADNFKTTQNTTDSSYSNLNFTQTPETITIGRPATTTATTIKSDLKAHGAISVYGSALNFPNSIFNESGRGPVLLKSTSTIALEASRTYQTNGSDLVFWASSGGGNGHIYVGNGACINTNASCDIADAVNTGDIYLGGGIAGAGYPTGPVTNTSTGYGIYFGTGSNSGVKVFSGGGDIEMRATAAEHGIVSWSGIQIDSGTGSILFDGTSTAAGRQGFRIAAAGTSSISSAKSSGTAIEIIGTNTSGSTAAGSNGLGIGYNATAVNISATGGGDIRMTGTVSSTGEVIASYFGNTTVTAAGGDVLLSGDWAELDASRLDASDGGSIQIKSTRHIVLTASTIETSGPGQGSGGEIAIWSDSDGDDVGRIRTNGTLCLNTIGSCSAPTATGGASIYLGGGSTADETGFYPLGGAPAGTTNYVHGIQFSNGYGTDVTKIWSGGGDISIASKTRTTGATNHTNSGQFWHGGTNVNSGNGQIRITNYSGGATTRANYGIRLNTETGSSIITSSKPTGEAIRIVSSLGNSGDVSQPIWLADGSSTVRNVISATGGGDIYLEGNASGTGSGTYSIDASNADILASTGNITLKGNRGVVWNRDASGLTNVGALSGGSATGNIVVEGNRFVTTSTWPLNFRTTGTITVKPLAGEDFLAPTTFPATGTTLTGLTGLTVGAPLNDEDLTVGVAASVAGPITYEGGAFTGTGALTNSGSGEVTILSSSTVALNANITSGSGGILVKSTGRITTSAGGSVGAPRAITTNNGPITLWTTGAAGGVTLNNYVHLNSNSSGTGGADITIGGGSADVNDPTIPGGNAASNANTGIILGTSNVDQIVRVSAGTGDVVIRGESTASSASRSGIDLKAGVKIIGGNVDLFGKANNPSATNNTASGIFHYQDSATAKTLIEATKGFPNHTTALSLRGETSNGSFGMMLSNAGGAAAVQDAVTIRTTGANADIEISGSTGASDKYSVQAAGLRLSTATGDVLVDSGDDAMGFSRSGITRKVSYVPVSGEQGGNITLRTPDIISLSTGAFNVTTTGVLTLEPPAGQSFARPQTFPLAGSVIDVGGLVVGSANNTANLTQGAAVTSSGDVKYFGGAQTSNFGVTTTNSGNIEFHPTTTFTKGSNTFTASGDILIGSSSAPATTIDFGSTTLSADGSVSAYASSTITQDVAMTAGDSVALVSGTNALIQKNITAGAGGILVKAAGNITTSHATSSTPLVIASSAGDITFHSDSDAVGGGYIQLSNFTKISTGAGAGDILISGGLDPETGFARGTNDGTTNVRNGVTLSSVFNTTSAYYGVGILVDSGTGDTEIRGWSDNEASGRGIAIPMSNDLSNPIQISGADVTLFGNSSGINSWYGIELGWTSGYQASQTSKVQLTASGTLRLVGESSSFDGVRADGNASLEGARIEIEGIGPRQPVRFDGLHTAIDAGASGFSLVGTKNTSNNVQDQNFEPAIFNSAGQVDISYNGLSSTNELVLAGDLTVDNQNVSIATNRLKLTGSISAGAASVEIKPFTSDRDIVLGTSSSTALLELNATEIGKISAGTLRIETIGDVDVTASLNLTDKVDTLAIRAGGDVTGSSGVVITVANLGIDAGGTIDFPGNQAASVIALNAAGVTYNQSADYTVASVDGIDPEYGYGVKFAIANVPTDETLDAFMAVAFNPPPTVKILDKFDNVLETNNLSAADFAVTPTLTAVSSSGTPSLAGTNPTRSAGTFTFSSLNVANATGEVTLTFAADRNGAALAENSSFDDGSSFTVQAAPTFTTASYNIQAGDPTSIDIAITSTSAPAGKSGFGITATLKDTGNNTIASGPHANAAITVSIAGEDGTIVSGDSPATVAGVADFSNLVVGGKVATNYTLTFSVTYTDTNSASQTVTETQVVTLTPGDATKLDVSPATQTQATGQALSDITVSVLDAYDNVVTSSTDPISISISAGSNGGSADFVGYSTPVAANSGQVVFNTLGINGTAGDYTLTFSSGSLATDTHIASMTHSVANRVDLVIPATAKNDVVLTTQPVVTAYDLYNNVVLDFTGTVALTVDSGSLGGTVSMDAVAGVADFADLDVKLIGTAGTKTVTATAASIVKSDTASVALTFGPATAVTLSESAAGFVNRVDFTTQPEITIVDSSGNPVEDFAGDVEISVSGNTAVLDGTTTISLVDDDNAVKRFSGLSLRGDAGSYTLTYSAEDLTSATQNVLLVHGVATQVELTAPATITNDTLFSPQPSIRILDADGNLVDSGNDAAQSVVLTSDATLTGTTTITTSGGLGTFSGLKLTGTIGSKTLTATISSPGTISGTANTTIEFGAATKLAITTPAVGFVNRTNFDVQPIVTVQDVSGNTVTDFAGDVSLEIGSGATITGTTTLTLTAAELGVANFADLGLEGTAGDYTITAKSDGLADATQNVTLEHGVAFKLTVSAPSNAANDTVLASQPVVNIFDEDDNLVTTGPQSTQSVTLTASGATLSRVDAGALSIDAVEGVANFAGKGLKLTGTAGSITLTATIESPSEITEDATINLGFGPETKLVITTPAVGFVNRTNFSILPTVTVQDVSGNTVADFEGDVVLSIGDGASITGTRTLTLTAADLGVANFLGLGLQGTAGDYTITASSGDLTVATQDITLTHGAATQVELTAPATVINDTLFSPQPSVRILDADGNLVDTGAEAVQSLTLTSNATLSGTTTITSANGVATFDGLTLSGTTGSKLLAVFSSGPSSISGAANTTIQFGAAAKLAITTPAAGFVNRTNFSTQPSVTVQDVSGNTVEDFSGNIALNIGSGASIKFNEPENLTAARVAACTQSVSGELQFEVRVVGSDCVVIFSSGTGSWTPNFDGQVQVLAVAGGGSGGGGRTPGGPVYDQDPGGGGGAGELWFSEPTVVNQNAVTIAIGEGGASVFRDFANGNPGGNTTFGTTTLRGGGRGAGANNESNPAGAGGSGGGGSGYGRSKGGGASIATVGVGFDGGSGSNGAASGGGGAGGPGQPANGQVGGAGGLGLEFDISGELVTYAAGGKGGNDNIAGQGGPTPNNTIGGGGGGRAGGDYSIGSTAGQPGIVIVRFASSVPSEASVNSQGGVSVAAVNGVANFSDLGLQGIAGDYTITASSPNLRSATQSVTLTHGAPTKIAIVQSAAGTRSGQLFDTPIQLEVQDADGNLTDTGDGATALITVTKSQADYGSGGADFGGTLSVSASGGVATFSDLTLSGVAGDYDLSFGVSSPGAFTGFTPQSESVSLLAGAKNSVAVVQQPTDAEAGVAFDPVVTVEVLDAWNNRILADDSSTISAAVSGEVLSTQTVVNGLATFTGLNVESMGTLQLRFASASVADVLSESFTVRHGPASKLVFVSNPTSARSDGPFASSPVLRILDQYDNAVTTGPTFTVTASVISSNSGDVQSLTSNQQASASGTEFLIFNGINLKGPIGDYTLRYTATDGTNTFLIDSAAIALGFGAPSQLNIATTADVARAGEAFGQLPVVEIQDSAGNIVTDSTLRVTASVAGKSLVGTDYVDAVAGIANFGATGLGIAGTVQDGLTLEFSAEYPLASFITKSQSIDLVAGPVRYLNILQEPTELVTRGTFSPAVEVELRDQYQNRVLSDSSTSVSALLYDVNNQVATATAGEPAISAISVQANAGVVDFSALSFAVPPASGYYIKFALPSDLDVVDSAAFKVVPGAVSSISIDQQPSTTNQDNSLVKTGELLAQMPQVSLYDQDGYLADNAVGSVTVSIASGSGLNGDLSEGITTATISSGQASFTAVKLVGKPLQNGVPAEQHALEFSFGGVSSSPSNPLSVTHNVAHKLVLQRGAANGRAGEAFGQQPIIEIQDRYNNIVESSNAAIRVGASAGATPTSGSEVNAQSGIARFTNLGIGGLTTNTYSITFEIPNTAVQTVTQSGVTLTYGVARKLQLTVPPVSLDGNNELTKTGDALAQQPIIQIWDAHDNLVENSNDIVTVSFLSTADQRDRLENEVLQAVNGVAPFQDLKLIGRPGQDYRLNFTSGQLTNTQSGVLQVRHADPDSIEIVTQPSAVIDAVNGVLTRTGNALHVQPQIRILDFDGNHADTATGVNVVASVVAGGGVATTDLDANNVPFNEAVISGGAASFSELKLVATPGVAQELQFNAVFGGNTILSTNSDTLTLTNGLASALAVHVEPCAGVDDGVSCAAGVTGDQLAVQPTVKVLDEYGNVVVDHVGDVVVSVSASGARLAVTDLDDLALRTVAVTSGYASFTGLELTANPGQAVKLNFASGSLAGVSSRDLIVAAAGATRLEMVTHPLGGRTGSELATQPQVKLVDRFGNTVLSDNTTEVTVTASGGNLFTDPAGPLIATANQGLVSFSGLRFTGTPGADFTFEFSALNVTSVTTATFRVTNAFANDLVITQEPVAGKTGDLLSQMPILELRDFDDNLAEDDNTTVVEATIDVSNGSATFVDSSDQPLGTAPSFTAVNGVVTFSDLRIVATPGTIYKLNFEATPASGPTFQSPASEALIFTHANPAQLVMTQSAIGGLAGADLTTQPTLEVRDRFGNKATGDSATVVTAVIETGASGDVLRGSTARAVNGEVVFTELALDGVPAQTYTLGFDAVSGFGDSFRLVDPLELTLSRPATMTLSMVSVAYVPDLVVTPVFTSDSAGLVTWSTTSDPGICVLELDGNNDPTGNVIVKGVGSCSLKAEIARFDFTHTFAPQSSYLASEISANLVITKAQQAQLTMSSANNVDFRGSLTLAASGGSGTGEVRYFVTGDCRVIGGVLLPGQAGAPCGVFARKSGDDNYERVDSDEQAITINRIAQSPLRIANSRNVAVGDIELFTSGGTDSGSEIGVVTYQVSTAGTAQCQIIDGNILRATQNGTCGVMATKQPTTNYLIAISPEVTFTFSKMNQTVNFNFAVPARPTPGTLFQPTAIASSGLGVAITISAGDGVVCEFDATETTKIRFLTSGSCELLANQAGSSQFNAASATLTIAADKLNQSITFNSILDRRFGDPKFQLDATASSSLQVSYSVGTSYQSPACSVSSSGLVTVIAAGMCEIVAAQPGNATYSAAPSITQIFSVAPDLAGAPHLVSVSVSNQAITAKFRAPSYLGGSQVSAYRLEATNGDGDTYLNPGCSAAGANLVCDLVGMPLNVAYTVKVAAVTAAGIGNYSDSSDPVSPGNTEIAVMKLSADQVAGQLEVSWQQPLALDGNFVSYEIFVWPVNTDIPEVPTDSISTLATESVSYEMTEQTLSVASFSAFSQSISIPMANSYNLKVVTMTDSSSSALTDVNVASGMQRGLGVPGRPRNEVLEADSQKLRVAWSEPNSDGGSAVTHYMIRKAGDAAPPCSVVDPSTAPSSGAVDEDWNFSLNQPAALSYEQTSLSAGSSYEIAIFACNGIGASAPAILTHSIPTPPTIGNTPYPGPILASFAPRTAVTEQVITVSGERLNLIDSMFMGNKPVEYTVISANQLRMKVPAGLADSVYDVIVYSSYGILTAQDALRVMGTPVNEDLAPTPVDPGTDPDSGSGENADADKPADQVDTDRDGQSNAVDPDINGDGTPNALDPDIDGDGIPNDVDPNPIVPNDSEDELSEPRPVPGDNSPQVDEENSLDEAVSDAISSAANSLLPLLLALSAILGVFGALRVRRRLVKTED